MAKKSYRYRGSVTTHVFEPVAQNSGCLVVIITFLALAVAVVC